MSTATATTTSLSGCTMQSMVAGTYRYPGMTSVAASAPMSSSTWPSTCLARGSNKEPSQTSTSGKRCDSQTQAADANKGPDGSSVVLLLSVFCPESRPHEQQLLLSPQSSCSRHEGHLQPPQSGRIQAAAALFAGKPAAEGVHKELDSARKSDRQTSSEHRNAGADSRLSTGVIKVSAKRTTDFDSCHSMALISGSIPSQSVVMSPLAMRSDQRPAVLRTIPAAKQIAVGAARHSGAENGDSKVGAADKAGAQCSCTSAVPVKSAGDRCSIGVQRFGGLEPSTAVASATTAALAAARDPTTTSLVSFVERPTLDVRQTTATASSAVAAAEVCCIRPVSTCASASAVRSPAALQFRRLLSPASCRALSHDLVNNPLFNQLKQQEEARACHTRQPAGNATASPATAGAQPSTRHTTGAAVASSTLSDRTQNSGDTTDGATAASTDRSHNRRQRLQQLEERREQLMMNVRGCRGATDSNHGADGSSHPRLEVFSLHQTSRCS